MTSIIGRRFGKGVVIQEIGRKSAQPLLLLICDCGDNYAAVAGNLLHGGTRSCGCGKRSATIIERFWSKVEKSSSCWVWKAARNATGYAIFTDTNGRSISGHRFSWKLHNGPIPAGMMVLHKCDNPPCVNPEHLFLGTNADNMHDRHAKGRYAKGADSWSAKNKNRLARGDKHGSKAHPERIARGERHGGAKLSADDVREIRSLLAEESGTHKSIAQRFGVDRTTVTAIARGKLWRNV